MEAGLKSDMICMARFLAVAHTSDLAISQLHFLKHVVFLPSAHLLHASPLLLINTFEERRNLQIVVQRSSLLTIDS